MNKKYMRVVAILVIAMISIGCIDKTFDKAMPTEIPTETGVPVKTDLPDNTPLPSVTDVRGNVSLPETTEMPGIAASPEVTSVPIEDTSVTKTFNIGDENNMLGVNVKLVNITDYDNNSVTLLINGTEYKYDSETTVVTSGIEIADVITLEDDKTAEVTVDYVTK